MRNNSKASAIMTPTPEQRKAALENIKYHDENSCIFPIKHLDTIRALLQAPQTEVVTVEEISQAIQTWRFDDDIDGAFGAYLMKIYPHGIRIVKEKSDETS